MEANKSLNRLESFSDGVFSIAITLLIFQIKFPNDGVEENLWAKLISIWPSLFAFFLSFFVILVTWISHHEIIGMVSESSRKLQLANGLSLLYVTLIPFVTIVLADNIDSTEASNAVALYCATFVIGSATFNLLIETVIRGKMDNPKIDSNIMIKVRRDFRILFLIYISTTILAFFLPFLALGINIAMRLLLLSISYKPTPANNF